MLRWSPSMVPEIKRVSQCINESEFITDMFFKACDDIFVCVDNYGTIIRSNVNVGDASNIDEIVDKPIMNKLKNTNRDVIVIYGKVKLDKEVCVEWKFTKFYDYIFGVAREIPVDCLYKCQRQR